MGLPNQWGSLRYQTVIERPETETDRKSLTAVGVRLDLDPLESEPWFMVSCILESKLCNDSICRG